MPEYLDLTSAKRLLKAQGFNTLDIECLLDLTAPHSRNGEKLWPADRIERLAARAYWLGQHEVSLSTTAAA
ncbi:MAG TPA: hypothetical protein PKA57_02705 [Parvibaculum sp.]|mgnify:CR=1 FL=1|uniref:hypothetical protein n=2 Tax=Parvibaculum sp. TaxID=2024848 RepID=UPI002C95584D|nr:hypothetical protein [Parvibaculum sp.]HMM13511.1 hypothetical protein [Parvibaculum sp.]